MFKKHLFGEKNPFVCLYIFILFLFIVRMHISSQHSTYAQCMPKRQFVRVCSLLPQCGFWGQHWDSSLALNVLDFILGTGRDLYSGQYFCYFSSTDFWRECLSLNLSLPTSKQVPGIFLSLFPSARMQDSHHHPQFFIWVLKAPMFAWQAL